MILYHYDYSYYQNYDHFHYHLLSQFNLGKNSALFIILILNIKFIILSSENYKANDEKNVFPYNTYIKRETSENLSKIVDPFTLILFSLIVSGYILMVI